MEAKHKFELLDPKDTGPFAYYSNLDEVVDISTMRCCEDQNTGVRCRGWEATLDFGSTDATLSVAL